MYYIKNGSAGRYYESLIRRTHCPVGVKTRGLRLTTSPGSQELAARGQRSSPPSWQQAQGSPAQLWELRHGMAQHSQHGTQGPAPATKSCANPWPDRHLGSTQVWLWTPCCFPEPGLDTKCQNQCTHQV